VKGNLTFNDISKDYKEAIDYINGKAKFITFLFIGLFIPSTMIAFIIVLSMFTKSRKLRNS
ncbi:MAG: hypothetical protein ACPLRT_06150, partial [Thermoproteota archaeon]